MQRKIELQSGTYFYELTKKRVKNINIRIGDDMMIKVSCPHYVTIKQVEECLKEKESFLVKAFEKITRQTDDNRDTVDYLDGDIITVFGKEYVLEILPGKRNRVLMSDDKLTVLVIDTENRKLREKTVNSFLMSHLKKNIKEIYLKVYPMFSSVIKTDPVISVKRMSTQWGSCSPKKNRISLNFYLVHYDRKCLEYVLIHEMCHYLYMDHSKNFYGEIEKRMPGYMVYQKLLKDRKFIRE